MNTPLSLSLRAVRRADPLVSCGGPRVRPSGADGARRPGRAGPHDHDGSAPARAAGRANPGARRAAHGDRPARRRQARRRASRSGEVDPRPVARTRPGRSLGGVSRVATGGGRYACGGGEPRHEDGYARPPWWPGRCGLATPGGLHWVCRPAGSPAARACWSRSGHHRHVPMANNRGGMCRTRRCPMRRHHKAAAVAASPISGGSKPRPPSARNAALTLPP